MGLDERPEHPLLDLGLGHGLDLGRRGSTPTTTSTTPTRTSSARTRTSATRSCASIPSRSGSRASSPSRSINVLLMLLLRVGRRRPRPRHRGDPHGHEGQEAAAPASSRGSAAKAGRQVVKDYIVFPALSGRKGFKATLAGELHRELRPQHLVERDHLLRALPRPGLHLHRGGGRRREPRRLVHPPADRRREHRGQRHVPPDERQPQLPGRAPPLPGHAELPLQGDRAEGQGDLRALRAALQHRPVPAAVADGPAHDPAARVPGRLAAAEGAARTSRRRSSRIRARWSQAPAGPIPAFP